ncbi:hypothetical protein Q0590_15155 [Rhodocytophaga aerolata]|uniref:Peptide chain release factor 1 n=1 Tax=Rhodocytophaga aerolata TaxID=455078 RepID=A0ABT8R681_9BACT|nr:hypothetical protein [Rhodocytophaga aerolata]MDO1447606.1 hypothetical protein [Rhodocytophaga aerolata]
MTNQEIQERIKVLSNQSAYPSVSILFPLAEAGRPTFNSPEHTLKVMIQETYQRLGAMEDERALESIKSKLSSIAKNMKFEEAGKSLGIFVSPEHEEVMSLPFQVDRNVFIGDNFQIRDLVKARNRLDEYIVLLLSEKKVLALRGAATQLSFVEIPGLPSDKGDPGVSGNALDTDEIITDQIDTSIERDSPSPDGLADQRAHPDQSSIAGVRNDEKTRYFMTRVDNALGKYLTEEGLRVVLVGVDRTLSHYKKFSKYTDKILGEVHGNYDFAPAPAIADLAWPVVQQKLQEEKNTLLNELENIGRNFYVGGIASVWRAAYEGRIRTLLVEENYQIRALAQDEGYSLLLDIPENSNGSDKVMEDAVDDLIELVMSRAGQIVFVNDGELEKHQRVAAICRY